MLNLSEDWFLEELNEEKAALNILQKFRINIVLFFVVVLRFFFSLTMNLLIFRQCKESGSDIIRTIILLQYWKKLSKFNWQEI